jgi:hypothetical protein
MEADGPGSICLIFTTARLPVVNNNARYPAHRTMAARREVVIVQLNAFHYETHSLIRITTSLCPWYVMGSARVEERTPSAVQS